MGTATDRVMYLVQKRFGPDSDPVMLISDWSQDVLGITKYEAAVIGAYALSNGSAQTAAEHLEMPFPMLVAVTAQLAEQGLVEPRYGEGNKLLGATFDGAARRLAVEVIEQGKAQQPREELSVKPLKALVVGMSREKNGLAKVYGLVFGTGRRLNYAALGKIGKLLGKERAALFLLENATKEFAGDPVTALMPLAVAEGKRFRPKELGPEGPSPQARAEMEARRKADREYLRLLGR